MSHTHTPTRFTRLPALIIASCLACLALSSPSAHAHGSLNGQTLTLEYGIDFGSGFTTLSSRTITVGSGLEVSGWSLSTSKDIRWDIDFNGADIAFTYVGNDDFMNVGAFAMQGFRIRDIAGSLPDIEDVAVTNTAYVPNTRGNLIEGFSPGSALSFSANLISVNLNESMYHHHAMTGMGDPMRDAIRLHVGLAEATPAVPEPSTWLMLGAGLAGLGLMRKRGDAGSR